MLLCSAANLNPPHFTLMSCAKYCKSSLAKNVSIVLVCLSSIFAQIAATAATDQPGSLQQCLLNAFDDPQLQNQSLAHVKRHCEQMSVSLKVIAPPVSSQARSREGAFLNTFEPYKHNYFSYGSMENRDGSDSFSGNTGDIRFQFGMKFGLFQKVSALKPIYFAYSQKSWWDIAESSAPFREHNYNPEIFWDYRQSNASHGFLGHGLGTYIDQIGFEHQSNGLDGFNSRSWDRVYAQKRFKLLDDRLSLKLKVWNIVNLGVENSDIADYYGNVELEAGFALTQHFDVNLTAMKGHQTGKFSYQLDLKSGFDWMNGKLFLSYYDGFGEALINYNQKSRSLRAGVYFPLPSH